MESEDTDFKQVIMKSACKEQDEINKRRYKIVEILKPIEFTDDKEKDMTINSFVKSGMTYEEIENFRKWRIERDEFYKKNEKKPIPGVS